MKFLYAVISLLALGSLGLGYYHLSRLENKAKTATELRYIACIESGKDAESCAVEQLLMRGLTCTR